MNTSWWISENELDPVQREFIKLPSVGRYQLEGPAGSGKTNLLLLRAQFVAGQGDKNVLVITYTRSLSRFLRSGLVDTGLMEPDQVRTFHSWAREHVRRYLKEDLVEAGADFDESVRSRTVEMLRRANQRVPTTKLISSVFIDEAQDLTADEIACLTEISDNVCVCGDIRQSIYHRDGLDAAQSLGLTKFALTKHYRIGPKIARVADRILPPTSAAESLEATSNYNERRWGTSSAELHRLSSRDEQFDKMMGILNVQLSAYAGDRIGILCGKRETANDVFERIQASDLADVACSHLIDGVDFAGDAQVHIMTMHSSKGVEFRAVHMFGIEELRGDYMSNPTLAYTAVTRAKTALNAYCVGTTNAELEQAFAERKHLELDVLFPRSTQ